MYFWCRGSVPALKFTTTAGRRIHKIGANSAPDRDLRADSRTRNASFGSRTAALAKAQLQRHSRNCDRLPSKCPALIGRTPPNAQWQLELGSPRATPQSKSAR